MKTIKEILELVLKEFKSYPRSGLCAVASYLCEFNKISQEERDLFEDYLKVTEKVNIRRYVWPINELKPRINWLETHIKLNS